MEGFTMKKALLSAMLISGLLIGNALAQAPQAPAAGAGAALKGKMTNINSATAEQLEQKLHLTKECAQQVVDYRTKNGPFKSKEDLKNVECVKATWDKVSGEVSVE